MPKALIIPGANFSTNRLDHVTFDVIHTEEIVLSPTTLSLNAIGATSQILYSLVPADAEEPVSFSSSNTAVATVTNSGLVTVTGVGTATITATSGSVSATCSLTVVVPLVDGYLRAHQTRINASTASNTVTDVTTYYPSDTWLGKYLSIFAVDSTQTKLPIPSQFVETISSGVYAYRSQEWLEANKPYSRLGWVVPIVLPPNCTKIRFTALNANYGVYPTFYKATVPDLTYELTAQRKVQAKDSDWTYTFEQISVVDVPSGYDSFAVTWMFNGEESADGNFKTMSDADRAKFTVEFL